MVVIYSHNLTYFEQITKRNILSNRFYAALEIFSEPKRRGRELKPQIFVWRAKQLLDNLITARF